MKAQTLVRQNENEGEIERKIASGNHQMCITRSDSFSLSEGFSCGSLHGGGGI